MVARVRYGGSVTFLTLLACDGATVNDDRSEYRRDTGIETPPGDSGDTDTHGGDSADTADEPQEECGEIAPDEAGWMSLFDASTVHEVTLTVSEESIAELTADPGNFAIADLSVDGVAMPGVGLRMRGDGTTERWDGKPSFRIDLRKFLNCEPFASVDELVLNAGEDDPTGAREVISTQLLDGMGVVVPRAVFATVTVNGEGFGLYTLVENVDAHFIEHHYDETGVLWEGKDEADFTDAGAGDWDDLGGAGDPASIDAVVSVVQTAGDDFYAQADALVDMRQFLLVWSSLAAVGHAQAYPYEPGDVFLFAPASDPRFTFIPWQIDQGWDPLFHYDYVGPCDGALKTAVRDALTTMDGQDPAAIASEAFATSQAAMAADKRRGTTVAEVETAREALLASMAGWSAFVADQL
jgi:hypothetical protein